MPGPAVRRGVGDVPQRRRLAGALRRRAPAGGRSRRRPSLGRRLRCGSSGTTPRTWRPRWSGTALVPAPRAPPPMCRPSLSGPPRGSARAVRPRSGRPPRGDRWTPMRAVGSSRRASRYTPTPATATRASNPTPCTSRRALIIPAQARVLASRGSIPQGSAAATPDGTGTPGSRHGRGRRSRRSPRRRPRSRGSRRTATTPRPAPPGAGGMRRGPSSSCGRGRRLAEPCARSCAMRWVASCGSMNRVIVPRAGRSGRACRVVRGRARAGNRTAAGRHERGRAVGRRAELGGGCAGAAGGWGAGRATIHPTQAARPEGRRECAERVIARLRDRA